MAKLDPAAQVGKSDAPAVKDPPSVRTQTQMLGENTDIAQTSNLMVAVVVACVVAIVLISRRRAQPKVGHLV